MPPTYFLYEQISPPVKQPFRIIETVDTCDGPRSRITNKVFSNAAEAIAALDELELRQ